MEEKKDVVPQATENKDVDKNSNGGAEKKTLVELLKENSHLQSEFDKLNEKSINTAKSNWENDAQLKQTEAQKLAKMDAEEKAKYELDKAKQEKQDALLKLNAYELKEQAVKLANEKGLDLSLLDIVDYSKETADTVKEKLEVIEKTFKKAVETGINTKLQEKSPRQVNSNNNISVDKEYLKQKYKGNPYLKV